MATPKKKVTTKKAPVKKTVAKKAVAKKPTTKSQSKKNVELQSFRPSRSPQPFMTFRVTRQTVYWLVFGVVVLALGAWVVHLNYKVQAIYDQIDANNLIIETLTLPEESKEVEK